jgi:alpha-galactosidase
MPRIAIIGAGSMVFSRNLISDILGHDALKGAEFALMDIDPERLRLVGLMGQSINRSRQADARFQTTSDRGQAIAGADYVINTIGVGGIEATRKDLLVPEKHGVRQVIGDTLSIGGIFRTIRSLPVVLEMVRQVEELAPEALFLNYANPMATHVLGIARASKIRVVGLCHGVRYTRGRMIMLARLVEMHQAEAERVLHEWTPHEPWGTGFMKFFHQCTLNETVKTVCAGINHMAAFLVFQENGRDLYPLLHQAYDRPWLRKIEGVRLELLHRLGYFMTETSGHIAEYLPWFLHDQEEIRRTFLRPNAYLLTCADLEKTLAEYGRKAAAGEPFISPDEPVSIEYASRILNAVETGVPCVFNGNVHNRGGALIANLPGDCCVEVPCLADAAGVRPTCVGELPPQIAAMIRTNVNVQDLVVLAILERKREHVYHAAYLDPNTASSLSLPRIKDLVDEMFLAHGELIPPYLRP